MKKLFVVSAALFCAAALFAQDAKKAAPAAPAPAPAAQDDAAKIQEENAKTLYSLGYMMGDTVKNQLVIENEDEYKYISQGMRDSMTGKTSQTDLDAYKPAIIKRYQDDGKKIAEKRAADNKKFLADAEKEKNAKKLDNGVIVQTVVKGKGASPSPSNAVSVNYTGTLIDGKVFDKSTQPAEFQLGQVIPCWTKGLQEMKAGGKAKLTCPPETAYGNRDIGVIKPNSVLVFDVELLDVK